MATKSEPLVHAIGGGVVGFDVEHGRVEALGGEVVEASAGHGRSEAAAVEGGIDGDDVDLPERGHGVAVDLGPAETGQSVAHVVEEKTVGTEPGLGHGPADVVGGHRPLLGVPGEGASVDVDEIGEIEVDVEGPHREFAGLAGYGERCSQLPQIAIGGKAAGIGDFVGGIVDLGNPELRGPASLGVSLGDSVSELGLDHGEIVASGGQTEGPTERSDERSGDFHGHGRVGASNVGLMAMRVSSAAMARPRTPAGRARRACERLAVEYPEAECELDHADAFQLLTATILSAQATDFGVNKATPALFAMYPTAEALAAADPERDIEPLINTIGLFRGKAKNIVGMARLLLERHGGEVPGSMKELTALPGVGRKTANVVRSVALGLPGLPVDTHVGRLAQRLALTDETDPVKVELELNPMVPAAERGEFSLRLILHGRRVCSARSPDCGGCVLNDFCPSAGDIG